MRATTVAACLTALLVLTPVGPARADGPVELELAQLAEDVGKVLEKQGQMSIRVGGFAGKGDVKSNFGPEIQRVLIEEFKRLKPAIAVDATALLEISGDYRPAEVDPGNPDLKEEFLRINAQVVNTKSGEPLFDIGRLSRAVYGNAALANALGVSGGLSPDLDRKGRNEELKNQIAHPKCQIDGAKVSSAPDKPFSVEILVVDRPDAPDPDAGREARKKDGLAFVDIKRGEFYRVKITNKAPFEAAVSLSIDGLDQYVFSNESMTVDENGQAKVIPLRDAKTGKPRYNYRIVLSGQSIVVAGWFRDLKTADAFVVTEYAKSAAAELNASPAEIGQIVAQFHACWEKDEDRPKDEGPDGRGVDATGRGPEVRQKLKEVQRFIGVLRDTVAVRYTKPQL